MDAQMEFAVDMKSPCCANKVEKALKDVPGIKSIDINPARQTVLVEGSVVAETVKKIIEKETGMLAAVMGQGSAQKENLGAAVAAIAVGPTPVRGLVRMTQVNKEMCVIEGTIDGFSDAKNVCVSLHESGDLTAGCESCGSPYSSNASNNHEGIFSSMHPESDGSIEFRLATTDLKVDEMIGRCIVIHDGNEKEVQENKSRRLACGIVARSSGLFQNTKRFCSCDGVTLWEEKKRLQEEHKAAL